MMIINDIKKLKTNEEEKVEITTVEISRENNAYPRQHS